MLSRPAVPEMPYESESQDDVTPPSVLREQIDVTGVVARFDTRRSFGFITLSEAAGGGDIFFHQKEVVGGKTLSEKQSVEFDVRFRGPDALRAVDITVAGERRRREIAQQILDGKRKERDVGGGLSTSFTSASESAASGLQAGLVTASELRGKRALEAAEGKAEGDAKEAAGAKKAERAAKKKKRKKKASQALLSFGDDDG